MIKKCTECKNEFGCRGSNLERSCWCETFPKELLRNYEDSCLCNACLTRSISSNVNDFIRNNDLDETVRIAQSFRDETRLFLDIDYTIEDDKYIFTEWYLLKRGFCCKSGCRNCPYPKD